MRITQKSAMLVLAAVLSAAVAQEISTAWYDDAEPDAEVYEIRTGADLRGLSEIVNRVIPDRFINKTVLLKNDIDLGGEDFTPIGSIRTSNAFMGLFDGGGHTISGLSVRMAFPSTNYYGYAGLFGCVTDNVTNFTSNIAQIKNVNVVASTVMLSGGNSNGDNHAGVLVGYYNSRRPIINCNVRADSVIIRGVSATSYCGGLAGNLGVPSDTALIRNSSAIAHILNDASSPYAGGLAGRMSSNSGVMIVDGSYFIGSVNVARSTCYAGGLIGYSGPDGSSPSTPVTVSDSYAAGAINANNFTHNTGGLIGYANSPVFITGSYADMNITNTVITGSASSEINSGGLIGRTQREVTVTYSYANGNISAYKNVASSGSYYVGGLIGNTQNSNITVNNSYASGEVSAVSNSPGNPYAGGILGRYFYTEGRSFTESLYYNSFAASGAAGQICNGSNCATGIVPGTTGLSGEDMKKRASFGPWDFNTVWDIMENRTTPFLRNINSVNNASYSLAVRSYIYTGADIRPEPEVWTKNNGGATLTKDIHYVLSYKANRNVGGATVIVSGINAYAGLYREIVFDIVPKELTVPAIQVKTKVYDGTAGAEITGTALAGICYDDNVYLTDSAGTFADLNVGADISVTTQMTIAGNAAANYYLTLPETLFGTITPRPLAEDAIAPIPAQSYWFGEKIAPISVTVSDGPLTLVEGRDYTVSYSNNTEAGIATATAAGMGNYQDIATAEFRIVKPIYTEDFEGGANGWVAVNGAQANKWMIGDGTKRTGSASAYISNNNSDNEYTLTSSSTVHIYKDIAFPVSDSNFTLTYHFKGMGQATRTDYMLVWYRDVTGEPSAGSVPSTYPGGGRLDTVLLHDSWTKRNIELPGTAVGGKTMRIIFTWINNASSGAQPPAAIDDISVFTTADVDPIPPTPTLAGKTHNTVIVNAVAPFESWQTVEYAITTTGAAPAAAGSWSASTVFTGRTANTVYYIFARVAADGVTPAGQSSAPLIVTTDNPPPAVVPFTEGFEEGLNGWVIANTPSQTNRWTVGTAAKNSGDYGAYITGGSSGGNSYNINNTSVSHLYRDITFPNSTSGFTMQFYFRGVGEEGSDFLRVYHSDTNVTPTAGTLPAVSSPSNFDSEPEWTQKTLNLPASEFSGRTRRIVFTWRNDNMYGAQPAAAIDDIRIYITGNGLVNAREPDITAQSESFITANTGGNAELFVIANANDGGKLSYQWYRNTAANTTGGTPIAGAANFFYSAPTDVAGTFYYYAVATNTNDLVNGSKTASATTGPVTVTVGGVINARPPNIVGQPEDVTVGINGSTNLYVAANVSDGGALSYRWYSNTANSTAGATEITGSAGAGASYRPNTSAVGTTYYYAVITNTVTDNGDGGDKTASVTSRVASVTVDPPTSTAAENRAVSGDGVDGGDAVAAVVPNNGLPGEFAVGPNPVRRDGGVVKIYRVGAAIGRPRSAGDNVLTVYDAIGNVINKITVSDNAPSSPLSPPSPGSNRREVGRWDLRDAKGRTVPAGAYLLRGTVTTVGGKREKVSLPVSVR